MKTIFLATCYFQPNYGSILQAFATQEFLDINNVQNQTINISGLADIIKQRKMAYFRRNLFNKDVILDKLTTVRLLAHKKFNHTLSKNICKRTYLFNEFSNSKFHLTESYQSFDSLNRAAAESASAVIVGSDQLWLPTNIEADYYTLNFVPDSIKKISYATSFGVSTLPKAQAEKAIKFLNRIDHLSVREQTGRLRVEKLIGKKPELVCDPVILLTAKQWCSLLTNKKDITEKYIFCYLLGNDSNHYR